MCYTERFEQKLVMEPAYPMNYQTRKPQFNQANIVSEQNQRRSLSSLELISELRQGHNARFFDSNAHEFNKNTQRACYEECKINYFLCSDYPLQWRKLTKPSYATNIVRVAACNRSVILYLSYCLLYKNEPEEKNGVQVSNIQPNF